MPPRAGDTPHRYGMKIKLPWHFSAALHALLRPFKRSAIAVWVFMTSGGGGLPPTIRARSDDRLNPGVVVLEKRAGRVWSLAFDLDYLQSRGGFGMAWRRLPAVLHVMSHPDFPEGTWAADLGDSVHDDGPIIGFCSNRATSLLIPDRGFHV
jgi:hypothetical protein